MNDRPANNGKGKDCIRRAVAAGMLDPQRAQKLIRDIEKLEAENFDTLGPIGARRQANADALAQAEYEAAIRKRATLMQLLHQDEVAKALDATEARHRLPDQTKLLRGLVDSSGLINKDGGTPLDFMGAQQHMLRLRSLTTRMMADILKKLHHEPFGIRTPKVRAKSVNILREIKGEATGDVAARQMAKQWTETAELLRRMYNAAGGAIPKLERWDLPQVHIPEAVRRVGRDGWARFLLDNDLLDRSAMLDRQSGKPLADDQLNDVLGEIFDGIDSKGWDTREPSGLVRGTSVAMRRQESRVLHFKDADSWLKYNERFGNDDIFSVMMDHIDGMTRDIGAMRALGPNPQATIRYVTDRVMKRAHEADLPPAVKEAGINRAGAQTQFLKRLYDEYIGTSHAPVNARMARSFSAVQQYLVATQLGSAVISALTDIGFTRVTAKFNGMNPWRVLARQISLLNPLNHEDRLLAMQTGLIADEFTSRVGASARFTGDMISTGWTSRLADGVLRISGLGAWTQTGRWAVGMELMGLLGRKASTGFDALDAPIREALHRYGVDAEGWDQIRATKLYRADKGGFLRPDDIIGRGDLHPKRAEELASKLLNLINGEISYAVPSSSLLGKAVMFGPAPGTPGGIILSSAFMYKNFAVTLGYTHMSRGINQRGPWNKAKYFGRLVIATTILGALARQLKNVSNGKDPEPMLSNKFWMAAMLQGGGLGLFGDFLFGDTSRTGAGLGASIGGPVAGFLVDTISLGQKAVGAVLPGANTPAPGSREKPGKGTRAFTREAIDYVGRYTPGSSLWYLRKAVVRNIQDAAQDFLDPEAAASFRGKRQFWNQNNGSDFWAPPGGGVLPERAPDWANAFRTLQAGRDVSKARRDEPDVEAEVMAKHEKGVLRRQVKERRAAAPPRSHHTGPVEMAKRKVRMQKLDFKFRIKEEHGGTTPKKSRSKKKPAAPPPGVMRVE